MIALFAALQSGWLLIGDYSDLARIIVTSSRWYQETIANLRDLKEHKPARYLARIIGGFHHEEASIRSGDEVLERTNLWLLAIAR